VENAQLNWLTGHSIAQNTWRTYGTAANLFKWFCKEKNIAPSLPVSQDTVTRYVLWLSFTRKVSQATISVYLSGLRQLHLQHGVDCAALRSDYIKMLLQGKKNSETRTAPSAKNSLRKPATATVLRQLKNALRNSAISLYEKRLIWTVSLILFFGMLRSSEILCVSPANFDPRFCACAEDIKLIDSGAQADKKLVITVKVPKEEKTGRNTAIEIFAATNAELCAVASWEKWRKLNPPWESRQPAFRKQNGAPFTQADLNARLKELLPAAGISSHSFRIGAATEMGQRGYKDQDIKATGRWSSDAFERYIRNGKTRRSRIAADFTKQF